MLTEEEELKVKINFLEELLKGIKNQLLRVEKKNSKRCENCDVSLWNNYYQMPAFVAFLFKDESTLEVCNKCASIITKRDKEKIQGAWDVPDPMGR